MVGAGPAGLAAAATLTEIGVPAIAAEQGRHLSARFDDSSEEYVAGVGGAGLYSDGKFSFFPSASRLWLLRPQGRLREAYEWMGALLAPRGVGAPPLPRDVHDAVVVPPYGTSVLKAYPSSYMHPAQRRDLTMDLAERAGEVLLPRTAARLVDARVPTVRLHPAGGGPAREITPRAVIYSAGRFGPLRWPDASIATFRRVEIGVRIEQPTHRFFLDRNSATDPKWIRRSHDGRVEWRTFCCCRDGEVLATSFDGIVSVSGRADCPPTGRSNVGLNVRFLDATEGMRALHRLREHSGVAVTADGAATMACPASSRIADVLGRETVGRIAEGLSALVEEFELDPSSVTLHAPAVEGLGYYPTVDPELRVADLPVWAAGDAAGVFRGIVAALVSGRVAAFAAAEHARLAKGA